MLLNNIFCTQQSWFDACYLLVFLARKNNEKINHPNYLEVSKICRIFAPVKL